MRIIPVIDLMAGQVVRAVGGRRQEYRPIQSRLVAGTNPLVIANALRDHFQSSEIYLADLDAIAGSPPAVAVFHSLQADGFKLLIDAGLRNVGDALPLLAAGISEIIGGLETVLGPEALAGLVELVGATRLVFSLDLKNGEPITASTAWRQGDAWTIAEQAIRQGVRRVLVLDVARVGIGTGTGTESLCARIKTTYPDVTVLTGGGVRGLADLRRLSHCGVDDVLVASALHDGGLSQNDIRLFQQYMPGYQPEA